MRNWLHGAAIVRLLPVMLAMVHRGSIQLSITLGHVSSMVCVLTSHDAGT
jgi:hypothetical protein